MKSFIERCPWLRRCCPLKCDKLLTDRSDSFEAQNKPVVKAGNILEAPEDYIAHQCNCCMYKRPVEGVAKAIYAKYPDANPYKRRDDDPSQIDRPGSCMVSKPIVNLYAQFAPGKPVTKENIAGNKWEEQFATARDKDLISLLSGDGPEERLAWFKA